MTTTTDIARAHGHDGPTNCQDCGTTENVHFGSWWNPETQEGGNFLQCCACGIKAGDPIYTHVECGAAFTRYVPNVADEPYSKLAFKRIRDRAIEAFINGRQHAARLTLDERGKDEEAVEAVLEAVGRAYAAAALSQAAEVLIDKLDEDTYVMLGDIAATLDLDVVEDLTGANGTGGEEAGPDVRVFHRPGGWTLSSEQDPESCTSNFHREQDGRPACPASAVWKVSELNGLVATLSFWCDDDLPAEHRPTENA